MNFSILKISLSSILFLIGIILVTNYKTQDFVEGFDNVQTQKVDDEKCPNLLVEKNNILYLYNKREPEIPGVNPVIFHNLEEYSEYIDFQRSKGIRCPVLYLQHMYNAQGKNEFKVYPSPNDTIAGISKMQPSIERERKLVDAHHDKGSMPGYDESGFDNGVYTPLDGMEHSTDKISDSAMDSHWGGVQHTQRMVDGGKYIDNTRMMNDDPRYAVTKYHKWGGDGWVNSEDRLMNPEMRRMYEDGTTTNPGNRRNRINNRVKQNLGKGVDPGYTKYLQTQKQRHQSQVDAETTNS